MGRRLSGGFLEFAVLGLSACALPAAASDAACAIVAAGPVTPALTASRVTGVAPLAVFFDASGTTSGLTARSFHDLEYRWDFGDPAGGATWSAGSRQGASSRNSATGPLTAHVFETPGSYAVTLTVGGARASCTIAVEDPDLAFAGDRTSCFSISGDFTGCPAGANRVTASDFAAVTGSASAYNKVRRLLLRRGEPTPWTATRTTAIRAPGPGILGAFGAGARPVIRAANDATVLQLSDRTTPKFSDWRVMDLELDGQSRGANTHGVSAEGGANQVTLLRVAVSNVAKGFSFVDSILDHWNKNKFPGHAIFDQLAIVDSSVSGSTGSAGVFVSARRFSFLGNSLDDTVKGQHVMRSDYIFKGVVSNNSMSRAAAVKQVLKLHAPRFENGKAASVHGGGYTEQVVLSDNMFLGAAGVDWTVAIRPQNHVEDERLRDILVERNWFRAGAGSQVALVIWAAEVTVRNNICDTTGGRSHACFMVEQRMAEPATAQIRLQNNTCYSGEPGQYFSCVILGKGVSNITVQNNLASAPRATKPRMIADFGASGVIQAGNSSDAQTLGTAPGWVQGTPKLPADFRLGPASPYIDAGTAVPVHSDFFGMPRPRGAKIDPGAAER